MYVCDCGLTAVDLSGLQASADAIYAEVDRLRNSNAELLAMLREAVDTVQGLYDPADEDDPAPAMLARWRAAIAKAVQP